MVPAAIADPWRVGELAKATGLTVRALHHYDEIGLLTPSHHTGSGHRLYVRKDLERLQQIIALRQLGFSLEQVKDALDRPDFSPRETISSLRKELRRRCDELEGLEERLADVERILTSGAELSTERLIRIVEELTMLERYLTQDQLAHLQARAEALGPDRIRESIEKDWPQLVAAIAKEVARGTDPADPRAQALARRWTELTDEVAGGDPATSAGLWKLYEHDTEAFAREKVGEHGPGAVEEVVRCVRYIVEATKAGSAGDS